MRDDDEDEQRGAPRGSRHGERDSDQDERDREQPKLNGSGSGDLLARLRLKVPTKLTKAEREAIENLQKVSREDPRERVFS